MLDTICIPCKYGHCERCMGGQAPPEGMLGGWRCKCGHDGLAEASELHRESRIITAALTGMEQRDA